MSKVLMGIMATGGILVLAVIILLSYSVSVLNREVDLRTLIETKQKDNTSEFDNMWKKISQSAQVTTAQKDALKEIFVEYADARTNEGSGKLMSWVQESVPNVDTVTFNNLQNIITSSRDAWTMRQKELLDFSREHNLLLRKFPSNLICSLFGRKEINIQLVTSTRTQESFATGVDNETGLF